MALSCTFSPPLIATFDADMIPRREFLVKTVPYFFIPEKKMGLGTGPPQSFYNQGPVSVQSFFGKGYSQ